MVIKIYLYSLCQPKQTKQGTVKFIFCDNFNFRSLFVMVIAFSRAMSVAVYKKLLDLLFQRSHSRFLRGRVVDDDGRWKRFLLGYHRDQFSSAQVEDGDECGFACAANPKCFSYNLEASISVTGTRRCELLPSEKYNNWDKFSKNDNKFNHYSIWVSDLVQYYLNFACCRRKAPKENTF